MAQFHHLRHPPIDLLQFVKGTIQVEAFGAVQVHPGKLVAQGHVFGAAAALPPEAAPGVIGQNHPHDVRREGEEMLALFPFASR
jgi:hypothetical protein